MTPPEFGKIVETIGSDTCPKYNTGNGAWKDLSLPVRQRPYKCLKCGKCFNQKEKVTRHMRGHTGEKHHSCLLLTIWKGLSEEKKRPVTIPEFVKIVELTDNTPSLYHCLKCGKKFKTKAHIKYHEFCADPNLKPFVCEICDKNFIAKSHFQYHQRTHTGERPYKCPKFVYSVGKFILNTGERPFESHFCKKLFGLKWTLDLHLRTHSAENPFACDECDRAFSNYKDLKRHKINHIGLRPFPCKICGTDFKRKDNLERHIRA
ncbi:unnamed protein product [Allacma fusca]|uniref:C2H2-type domain-containing protein n=1 Tax=Allacma fusca TaxID=39272 RepID=A0A8J2P0C9_9HEXA|nr:unnamed protein product [Allacma fusca]